MQYVRKEDVFSQDMSVKIIYVLSVDPFFDFFFLRFFVYSSSLLLNCS